MQQSKYISWDKRLLVTELLDNSATLYIINENDDAHEKSRQMRMGYSINDTATAIISVVNGMRTKDEVICLLTEKYNDKPQNVEAHFNQFTKTLKDQYNISLLEKSMPEQHMVNIEKGIILPRIASIEITDRCNLKCLHCYGEFDKFRETDMSICDIKKVLFDLNEIGVLIVELTGGECLVHPDFTEILKYALSLDFAQIAILSNGIGLTDEIMQILADNNERVAIQLDLHSLDDDYYKWFTGYSGYLNHIKNRIVQLSHINVLTRVATIVTKRNVHELYDIADWIQQNSKAKMGVNSVINLGRAKYSDHDLRLDTDEYLRQFTDFLTRINEKTPGFITQINSDIVKNNCGCVSSHVTIHASGQIKVCTMDNMEYVDGSSFGNVIKKSIKEIYRDMQTLIMDFYKTPAPVFDSADCSNCARNLFCSGCLLRSFIAAKEMGDRCGWYKKYLSAEMKKILSL